MQKTLVSKRLLIGIASFFLICSIVVGGWLQYEISAATHEWNQLGGSITVLMNSRLGPDEMNYGTTIGNPTSPDIERIRAAALRINRWPACRKIQVANQQWTTVQTVRILDSLRLEYIGFDQTIDHTLVDYLSKRSEIKEIGLSGQTGVGTGDLRQLLGSSSGRRIVISGVRLTPEENEALEKEFGERFFNWNTHFPIR